jgi:hypothetical protein
MSLSGQSDQINEDSMVYPEPEPEPNRFNLLDFSEVIDLSDSINSSDSSVGLTIRRSQEHLPLNHTPTATTHIQSPFKEVPTSPRYI